jgi:hypothetical protein
MLCCDRRTLRTAFLRQLTGTGLARSQEGFWVHLEHGLLWL